MKLLNSYIRAISVMLILLTFQVDFGVMAEGEYINEINISLDEILTDSLDNITQDLVNGQIAFIGLDRNVWIIYPNGSGLNQITNDAVEVFNDDGDHMVNYGGLKWSPDGLLLAFQRYEFIETEAGVETTGSLLIYDVPSDNTRLLLESPPSFSIGDWNPDGSSIIYDLAITWGQEGPVEPIYGIWQIDIETGSQSELVPPERGLPLSRPKWSPSGRYISFEETTYLEGAGYFAIYDLEEGNYIPWDERIGNYSWFPNKDSIVFDKVLYGAEEPHQLWVTDINGYERINLTSIDNVTISANPQVSPDGKHIAFHMFKLEPIGVGGLWVINTDGGNPIQLMSIDKDIPFDWSPDGLFLVVSSGPYQDEKLSIIDLETATQQVITSGKRPDWGPEASLLEYPTEPAESPKECGTWSWKLLSDMDRIDPRIMVEHITQEERIPCRHAFELSNETPKQFLGLTFGGYTLELESNSLNALSEWKPQSVRSNPNQTYLTPNLDIELHVVPIDPNIEANVNVQGDYTIKMVGIDLSLFLIRTAFALGPPGISCVIPEEQLLFTAIRTANILSSSIELALNGDFIGAEDEFRQVGGEFFETAAEAMEDSGMDCATDILQAIWEKPGIAVDIGAAYLGWVGVYMYDYLFTYQGVPVRIRFQYEPPQ